LADFGGFWRKIAADLPVSRQEIMDNPRLFVCGAGYRGAKINEKQVL
jgi:hypothetical protein